MKRFKALISGAPDTWQRSAPLHLDEGSTKPGPARFRLVHLLCPFGKTFFGETVRTRVHAKSTLTHVAKVGDERLPFSADTWMRWRLTRRDVLAQIGTTMTGFDASNAFMSVHHTTLDKLVEASFEDEIDRALMKQRYRGAQTSLCENSDEPRVEVVPSCGFCRETLLASLFLKRNGEDTARRQTLTCDICACEVLFYMRHLRCIIHHFCRRHHETNCHECSSGSDHKIGRNVHNVGKVCC